MSIAEIIDIEYFTKKNAPYPLDKIKMILPIVKGSDNDFDENKDETLVLCDKSTADGHFSLWAEFSNGCLIIYGQDLGQNVEKWFGKDSYEYFYSFDQENTKLLFSLLKQEEKNVKKAMLKRFSGLDGWLALKEFCKYNNIKYNFHSC